MNRDTINVMELFAGVGGFRLGLERADSDVFKTVWANQWEPSRKRQDAFNCYVKNFGEEGVSNEDIGKVAEEQFRDKDIDMIVGGFPCFAAGTLITTSEGVKPIEDIRKGEKVLTHTNTFKRVVVSMVKKKRGIYELKVHGSPKTLITEEHPLYVREKSRVWDTQTRTYKMVWSEPKWVETKDLIKGVHYIAMSENKNNNNPYNITKEDAWLIGRYLADGYKRDGKRSGRKNTYNNQVVFYVGKDKLEEFKQRIETYHLGISEERTIYKCSIIDERLRFLCTETERGVGNKRIPGFIMDLPKDFLEQFLEGYMSGDGSRQGNQYRVNSISKELIYGLGQVVQKLYNTPYRIRFTEKHKKISIEGRVENQQDSWEISFYKELNKRTVGHYVDGMLYMPIKSLEYREDFNDYVYNFEVEEDNSYVANNLTVHNCQDYSVARSTKGKQGIEGKKGVLFWDIARFVAEIRPKYILLENVDRLIKTPTKQRGRDFGVMLKVLHDMDYYIEWRILDASHHGGSQRRVRIFIFALREDMKYVESIRKESAYNIITKKGFFAPSFPVVRRGLFEIELEGKELNKDLIDLSDNFRYDFKNAGFVRDNKVYTMKVESVKEEYKTLGEILEDEVDDKYYLTEEQEERFKYLRGKKEIERTSESGHKYIYREGSMSEVDSLDKPSRTMLTSEGNVTRTTHIIDDGKGKRFLTPVECERLNNFPDKWTEGLSDRMRYFCMGNALVVGLVEKMGKRILEIDADVSNDNLTSKIG